MAARQREQQQQQQLAMSCKFFDTVFSQKCFQLDGDSTFSLQFDKGELPCSTKLYGHFFVVCRIYVGEFTVEERSALL